MEGAYLNFTHRSLSWPQYDSHPHTWLDAEYVNRNRITQVLDLAQPQLPPAMRL